MKHSFSLLFLLVVAFTVCAAQLANPGQRFRWDEYQVQSAKQSLASETKISLADRAWLKKRLTKQYKGDRDPGERAAETRVQLMDLNSDGVPMWC